MAENALALAGEAGQYTMTDQQLTELGIWEAHLLQWTLDEAIAARPDLEVQVSRSIHDRSVTVRWRKRA